MSQKEIVAELAKAAGINKTQAKEVLWWIIGCMSNDIRNLGRFHLDGIGTFNKVTKPGGPRRNPATGEKVTVGPSNTVRFKVAKELKEAVAQG